MSVLEKVGRVSKPFGREGELLINLYDTFPEDFNIEEPLFAKFDSLTVPLFFDKFERRGKSGALVKFADFETDSRAQELLGMELFLEFADEGERSGDEVYFEDLVGYAAMFEGTDLQGVVSAFVESEHNPLIEVIAEGHEIYVPANDEMISYFDPAKREIGFSLPEGLLELYL